MLARSLPILLNGVTGRMGRNQHLIRSILAIQDYENGFKVQWEEFLRHVLEDKPFPYTLLEGAKGVQLAEAGLQSWRERRWVDLPVLNP